MSKNLMVRTQIYNPETGRFIKAIDSRSLLDYLSLIGAHTQQGKIVIPDLSPIINELSESINAKLEDIQQQELSISHSLILNLWNKAKFSKNESVKEKLNIDVIRESERALNLIHTRISRKENSYTKPQSNQFRKEIDYEHEKNIALDGLLKEIQVFIEIMLCHIHSSAIIDTALIEEPSTIAHCKSLYLKLQSWLRSETEVNEERNSGKLVIGNNSLIHQCCFENNLDINPSALLSYIGISQTPIEIINNLMSKITTEENYDNWNRSRPNRTLRWQSANSYQVERSKKILLMMQQIANILSLFQCIENKEIEYGGDETFFDEVRYLIESKT